MQLRFVSSLLVAGAVLSTTSTWAATPEPHTVNYYSPSDEHKAKAAARAAGFEAGSVTMAQAGYLFLTASRGGHRYALTVTPEGKVFASAPSD